MSIPSIKDCDLNSKIVLVRVDFNVPIQNGKIQDITRIVRVLPSINYLINARAKVALISHLGRPKGYDSSLSLKSLVPTLSQLLGREVKFVENCIGEKVKSAVRFMAASDVILLENLRFYDEEEKNDAEFAKQLASIADIYVNDAFSCSHRAHASISRITEFIPSYAGLCLKNELKHLEEAVSFHAKPITAIVGGMKISTKVNMIVKLAEKVDYLILGGAIANNFLLFNKANIGKSFFQKDVNDLLASVTRVARQNSCKLIVPEDVMVAINSDYSHGVLKNTGAILDSDVILDIGSRTLEAMIDTIKSSKTVLWNGPIGAFEHEAFASGTIDLMKNISDLTHRGRIISIIGGGDSLSAISAANLNDKDFTYVSTGGGAFLSWLSENDMPGITTLQECI